MPDSRASRDGGVRWSAEQTRDEVAAVPELRDELGRRGGHVPVLRLTWADVPKLRGACRTGG